MTAQAALRFTAIDLMEDGGAEILAATPSGQLRTIEMSPSAVRKALHQIAEQLADRK